LKNLTGFIIFSVGISEEGEKREMSLERGLKVNCMNGGENMDIHFIICPTVLTTSLGNVTSPLLDRETHNPLYTYSLMYM
jgi:hypothetical protein